MTSTATDSATEMNVGEASIKLLEAYGVDTVFGIPGVHTLEFCRGLNQSSIRHVQARNEQGAGFMADGYARASGKPGVALLISGPGLTNALTAMGQAYADSIPMLVVSADATSHSLGKGWGCLHEVTSLTAMSAPVTAFSATAMTAQEVPALIARAFSVFSSERPRPVHIAIPIDVLEMPATGDWQPIELPQRPTATANKIERACALLRAARQPMICVGGGATLACEAITEIAEKLGAPVISSIAGKGIVAELPPPVTGRWRSARRGSAISQSCRCRARCWHRIIRGRQLRGHARNQRQDHSRRYRHAQDERPLPGRGRRSRGRPGELRSHPATAR